MSAIYIDGPTPGGRGGRTESYAQCVPFFDALAAERLRCAELGTAFEAWQQVQQRRVGFGWETLGYA